MKINKLEKLKESRARVAERESNKRNTDLLATIDKRIAEEEKIKAGEDE